MARAQFRTVAKIAFSFVLTPLVIHLVAGNIIIKPLVAAYWNSNTDEIFLNETQQERALKALELYDEIEYYDRILTLDAHAMEEPEGHTFHGVQHFARAPDLSADVKA